MLYTIQTLNQLFKTITEQAVSLTRDKHGYIVQVEGVIGELKDKDNKAYPTLYMVKLSQGTDFVLMDIPRTIIEKNNIQSNQYVKVTGTIKTEISSFTQNKLTFRVDVTAIESVDSPEHSQKHMEEQKKVQSLLRLNAGSRAFPLKSKLTITYVTGNQSKVEDDFLNALASLKDFVETKPVRANMLDKASVAKAISEAKGDILAIIRGGGAATEFQVFNEPEVLTALSACKGYRMVGLGHASDATLSDLIADFSGTTPTELAVEVRDKYTQYLMLLKNNASQENEIKKLTQDVTILKNEISKIKQNPPIAQPVKYPPATEKQNTIATKLIIAVLVIAVVFLVAKYVL